MSPEQAQFVMKVSATPYDPSLGEPAPEISEVVVKVDGAAALIMDQVARARMARVVRRERLPWLSLECNFALGPDEVELRDHAGAIIQPSMGYGGLHFEQRGAEFVLSPMTLRVAGSDVVLSGMVMGEIARYEITNCSPPRLCTGLAS